VTASRRSSSDAAATMQIDPATDRSPRRPSCAGPTTASETRKTGWQPGLPIHRRCPRRTRFAAFILAGPRTDFQARAWLCALLSPGLRAIANTTSPGAGDGLQPDCIPDSPLCGSTVSHAAIAGVLASDDLSAGERLVVLSLASFANSEQRAWPGNPAAAARAGLGRSRYLEAREQLVARGLLEVEDRGRGRGQATTMIMLFAQSGPWWDAEINARLLEVVLGHSRARGPARLLLAALAALADGAGVVDDLPTDELCRAAGLANSTYRRARRALLASGEVELVDDGGGRGRTNRWRIIDPAEHGAEPAVASPRRRAPAPSARPLLSPVRAQRRPASESGVSETALRDIAKGPILTGVSGRKGPILSGVSGRKSPILSGVSDENPVKTPPETPPPNARAGREPLNPGIRNPPSPPEGGSNRAGELFVEETYRTPRGRLRRRQVAVDTREACAGLLSPGTVDDRDWTQIRELLVTKIGESMFEIWLAAIELRAVDADAALILIAPDATREWVRTRYGRLIAGAADQVGRRTVIADAARSAAIVASILSSNPTSDLSADASAYTSYDTSACQLSHTPTYNSAKEVGSW
jgi:DnaA N-terminal domain